MGMSVSEAQSFVRQVALMSISNKEVGKGKIEGGAGRIGMTEDGKVFKFNTHFSERFNFVTNHKSIAMTDSCNRLRNKLYDAVSVLLWEKTDHGLDGHLNKRLDDALNDPYEKKLRDLRRMLCIGENDTPATTKSLLDRTVTAKVLNMIVEKDDVSENKDNVGEIETKSKESEMKKLWNDIDGDSVFDITRGLSDTRFNTMLGSLTPIGKRNAIYADKSLDLQTQFKMAVKAMPQGNEVLSPSQRAKVKDDIASASINEAKASSALNIMDQVKKDLGRNFIIRIGGKEYGNLVGNEDYDELFNTLEEKFGKDTVLLRTVLSNLHQGVFATVSRLDLENDSPLKAYAKQLDAVDSVATFDIGEKDGNGSVKINTSLRYGQLSKIVKNDGIESIGSIPLDSRNSYVEYGMDIKISETGNGNGPKVDVEGDVRESWNFAKGADTVSESKKLAVDLFKSKFPEEYADSELRAHTIDRIEFKLTQENDFIEGTGVPILGEKWISKAIAEARRNMTGSSISEIRSKIKGGSLDNGWDDAIVAGAGKSFSDLPDIICKANTRGDFSFAVEIDKLTDAFNHKFRTDNPLISSFTHELDRSLSRFQQAGMNHVPSNAQKIYLARRSAFFCGVTNYVMDQLKGIVDKKIKSGLNPAFNEAVGKAVANMMNNPEMIEEISEIVHGKYQGIIEKPDVSRNVIMLAQHIGREDDPDFGRTGNTGDKKPEELIDEDMIEREFEDNGNVVDKHPALGVIENLAKDSLWFARNSQEIQAILQKHGLPENTFYGE